MSFLKDVMKEARREPSPYEKKVAKYVLMIGLPIMGIITLVGIYFGYTTYKEEQAKSAELGCENFEDCLSQYKFEGAYYYYKEIPENDKYFSFKKLISSQVNYWCGQNDFERAFNILNEHAMMATYDLKTSDASKNDKYNEEASFMNSQLEYIINQMLVGGVEKDVARRYLNAYKPIVIGNDEDKGFFGGYNSFILSNQPYDNMVEKLSE